MSARHLLGCAAAVLASVAVIAVLAPSASTLALIAVFLLCPLAMVIAMKLLMGGGPAVHEQDDPIRRSAHPEEIGR